MHLSIRDRKVVVSVFIALVYLVIKYLLPSFYFIFYPITLLVTFLHELGHVIAALLTGGSVLSLNINPNGGGFAITAGGVRGIVLLGGYIGSALLGNFLLYIAVVRERFVKHVALLLSIVMVFTSLFWFSSLYTTVMLWAFAALFVWLSYKKRIILEYVLMGIGILSVIYIIEDFNVGPSSDLHKFADIAVGGYYFWMIVWLVVAVVISYFNFRTILKKG